MGEVLLKYIRRPPADEFGSICMLTPAAPVLTLNREAVAKEERKRKNMAESLIGLLAWGALKLTSSLVSAGFKKLIGVDEDAAMVEWSGDVVLKASEKSHQQQQAVVSSRQSPDMAPMSRAMEADQHEVGASGISGSGACN